MTILTLIVLLLQDDGEAKLEVFRPRLASEDPKERSQAAEELRETVDRTWRAALQKKIEQEKDPEVKECWKAALDSIQDLKLTIVVDGDVRVGGVPKYRVRIKNLTDEDVIIPRSLDGSDDKMRYPFYTARFFGPDRREIEFKHEPRCGMVNPLKAEDLLAIKPGAQVDPLGEGSFSIDRLGSWSPDAPGRYRVEIDAEFNAPTPYAFGLLDKSTLEELLPQVAKIPKIKLRASVEFEVKP